MDTSKPWFKRLGELLQPHKRGAVRAHELPPIADDGLLAGGPDGPASDVEAPAGGGEKALGRWARRDQALLQLQDGYQRMTDLIDAMQKHMAEQGQRTDRIAISLDKLARTMADLPAVAREQTQMLAAISSHLDLTNAKTQQLAESIRELPGASKAQGEAIHGMSRQLEMANETSVQMNHTLRSLGEAVDGLRISGREQGHILRQFQVDGAHREGRLGEIITQQNRRFALLFIITLIFAIVGACGTVLLAVRGL